MSIQSVLIHSSTNDVDEGIADSYWPMLCDTVVFLLCVCVHLECALVASFGGGGDDGGRSVASTIPSIKMLDVQTLWSNDIVECQMVANSHKFKRFYLVDSTLNIIQLAIFSSANEFVVSFLQCI